MAGLFNAAFKDDRINSHPFLNIMDGLNAGEGGDEVAEKVYDIPAADACFKDKLPALDADLYMCLRWTGCRIAEMAGIKSEDINLEEGYINLVP